MCILEKGICTGCILEIWSMCVETRSCLALSVHVDSVLEQMPGSVILQSILYTCMQYGLHLLRKPVKTDFCYSGDG